MRVQIRNPFSLRALNRSHSHQFVVMSVYQATQQRHLLCQLFHEHTNKSEWDPFFLVYSEELTESPKWRCIIAECAINYHYKCDLEEKVKAWLREAVNTACRLDAGFTQPGVILISQACRSNGELPIAILILSCIVPRNRYLNNEWPSVHHFHSLSGRDLPMGIFGGDDSARESIRWGHDMAGKNIALTSIFGSACDFTRTF